jgi:outer membrane cobalamin receptor
VRYQLVPQFAFKGAMGFYTQPPSVQTLFGPFGNVKARPETALHYVLGFDVNPYSSLSISAEGFYKDLRDVVVGNVTTPSPVLVNEGIGRVYGAEILIRQQFARGFFGWVSYTLSRSERKDHPNSPDWRVFEYDQTHILTVIASYKFGRGYQVGARFRYTTGNPITPVLGGYVNLNRGGYSAINGPLYSGRLGAFQQLDIRFDKEWTFKRASFSLFLDIQNVYNASNPEGYQYSYNYKQVAPVAGIPFFPDLGLRVEY